MTTISMPSSLPSLALKAALCLLLYPIVRFLYALLVQRYVFSLSSPLRDLPRVKECPSMITGANEEIGRASNPGSVEKRWMQERNSTIVVFPSYLGTHSLYIADPLALHHIFMRNENNYPKALMRTRLLAMAVGQGLVTVHDAKHRKQRKMMMPAFHLETLKTFVPTFLALGKTMVAAMKEDKGLSSRYDGSTFPHVVDVSKYAEAATLDLIGLTGFKYNFGAMDCLAQKKGVESELARGLRDAMNATLNASTMDKFVTLVLSALFPSLATLPFTPSNRAWRRARRTMESVTSNILDERLKKLVSELQDCGESIEKVRKDQQGLQDQDLLTTLLRANLAVDVSPKERLDRQELLGQLTTFLLAGHETTSAATTWLLYFLSSNTGAQERVTQEIDELFDTLLEGEEPTWDQLASLTYTNACVTESQRLKPSIPMSHRDVLEDDMIPLSRPQPTSDGKGQTSRIAVPKGTVAIIGIAAVNRSEEIWGPDAEEFRPERWFDLPISLTESKAPPTKSYTFLHGRRNCIGWRYAQMEVLCLIVSVLREFSIKPTGEQITSQVARIITGKPVVVGREKEGAQMPISLHKRQSRSGEY